MAESSNQGQTRRQGRKLKPRFAVWNYFTRVIGDDGKEKAKCMRCGILYASHGTKNQWEHLPRCRGEQTANQEAARPPPQQRPPSGATVDREPSLNNEDEARQDLARMIVLHGYDPSVVEDDYFRSFTRRLNPGFEVPSRRAIEEMCGCIFQESDWGIFDSEWEPPYPSHNLGKVSVGVGEAKTIETGQVVYVTNHFIDGHWNLHREVEDVYLVLPVGDHYHVPLRPVPVVSFDDAADHIMSRMKDQYDKSVYETEMFMIAGEMTGHINHLKLKGCMEKQGLVTKIYYIATYMDHVLHSIARCLLPDSELAENIFNTIKEAKSALLLLENNQKILTKLGLAKFGLLDDPWEYNERWYSCYCSLEIFGQTFQPDTDDCREVTKQLLCTVWRAIYRAIKRVSNSSRPTSNLCLRELFNVRDVFKSELSKAPPAAYPGNDYSGFGDKNAADILREVLETVDKAIQDSYLVWSIPLVLDPRYKLKHIEIRFKRAFGLEAEKYVSEVRKKIKELYTRYSEDDDDTEHGDEDSNGSRYSEDDDDTEHGDDIEDGDEDSDGSTEEMSVDSSTEAKTQLDRYLDATRARRTKGFDILNWWKVYGSDEYPTVARMARDALAMPTCSKLTSDQMARVKSTIRGYGGLLRIY